MHEFCGSCEWYDDGLCDTFGTLVEEDDIACKKWMKRRMDAEREKEKEEKNVRD